MTALQISGDDLRAVRYHLELTQAGLGERLGVAVRTIVKWEAEGVPGYRVPRVHRQLGPVLQEALNGKRSILETSFAAVQESATPEERRSHLLHPFTDLDLLTELQARALRREAARAS